MTIQFPAVDETEQRLASARHTVVRRVRRRRRVTAGAAVGAVLLAAATGVGATLVVQQISPRAAATSVVCYSHDDLDAISAGVGVADATSADGVVHRAAPADKAELCALAWRGGLAVQAAGGHPKVDSFTGLGDYPVPPLAFCLLRDGATGGFPIEAPSTTAAQVCDRLGLAVDVTVPAS